jgi:hypothetical protein
LTTKNYDVIVSKKKSYKITMSVSLLMPGLLLPRLGMLLVSSISSSLDYVLFVAFHWVAFVVTDTESIMVEAGRLFKQKCSGAGGTTAWHGCINKMLELITKLASNDLPNSGGTMSAFHSLVNFFDSSSQALLR